MKPTFLAACISHCKTLNNPGTSVASEPLNFFIIVIYDLWPTYSFLLSSLTATLEIVALTTSRIYLMIYLIDITNIDKICD